MSQWDAVEETAITQMHASLAVAPIDAAMQPVKAAQSHESPSLHPTFADIARNAAQVASRDAEADESVVARRDSPSSIVKLKPMARPRGRRAWERLDLTTIEGSGEPTEPGGKLVPFCRGSELELTSTSFSRL